VVTSAVPMPPASIAGSAAPPLAAMVWNATIMP
jgi:hypothetical protein